MWLRVVERPGATVFALLSGCEAFSRALIAGVLPIQAYRLLESAQTVSLAYTAVGVVALVASFLVPLLMRRVRRKWIFTAGCLFMIAGPLMLMAADTVPLMMALLLRALAVVCVHIAINLYILDYIRRKDFVTAEPRRLAVMGISWSIGPGLGIYLLDNVGMAAVCVPSATAAAVTLAYFWLLRMQENAAVAPATGKPPMPWDNIRRYMAQPRLRLAWLITFSRSSFWATFFVYPAVYIAQHDGDPSVTAVLYSAAQALLFTAPLAGRLGKRTGIRPLIVAGFVLCGGMCIAAGLLRPGPVPFAAMIWCAAAGAATLDALGNIPFLRAVRARERAEMTSVFRTYIEFSQLLPVAVYSMLLAVAPVSAVFVLLGLFLLVTAVYATRLPRRL